MASPPHEGYWQQLYILVEVLNQREREKREVGELKEIEKGGREGGGEGEQVVQTVESYISSPRLLGRIFYTCLLLVLFFFSEGDELCIILRTFPQCSLPQI